MSPTAVDPLGILTGPYTLSSLTPPDLSRCTNREVLEYFDNTYSLNESIFTAIKREDVFYMCPDRLRLPLIFYYGHTASVYINKLVLAGLITERVNFEMETMFETGVDEMNWDDTENYRMGGSYRWPSLSEVKEFRRKVRDVIRRVIKSAEFQLPITMDSPHWVLFMGFEHERIHLETSSVLITQLPIEMVRVPSQWKRGPVKNETKERENQMRTVPATRVLMGKPFDFPSYGWDNEYPQLEVSVPSFEASECLVTNGEFYQFVLEDGYNEESFWTKEGWEWKTYRQAIHPTFWVCTKGCKNGCGGKLSKSSHCQPTGQRIIDHDEGGTEGKPLFRYRTLCEVFDMPWTWPVSVNYHEARAFCRWKGEDYRLLTEAEHNAIRDVHPVNANLGTSCDPIYDPKVQEKCNINLAYCTSTPVDHYPPNKAGFFDVFGNVWQWTEDHFNGFPGVKTTYLYDDFSFPCFDGRHNIILGGSWISTGDEASRFARYSFRRHFFQHAGFRLARSKDNSKVPARLVQLPHEPTYEIPFQAPDSASMMVETSNTQFRDEHPRAIDRQLVAEYSYQPEDLYSQLSGFIQQLIKEHNIPTSSAMVLNTGCGRMTFELCRYFSQVIGTDFSGAFIKACMDLQQSGSRKLESSNKEQSITLNGNKEFTAEVPIQINPSRALFKQFTWVPNELSDFNFVVVENLHRVCNRQSWVARLWEVIKPSALVVISSTEGFGEQELQPLIGTRLKCIQNNQFRANSDQQEASTVTVTTWSRNV